MASSQSYIKFEANPQFIKHQIFFSFALNQSERYLDLLLILSLKNKLINILNFITLAQLTMRKSGSHFKNDPHKDYHSVD